GNKARSVPLNASAREALAVCVASRLGTEKSLFKTVAARWPRPGSPESHEPLFLSQKGGALTTSAMGQMIADLVKAAGGLVPEEASKVKVDIRDKRLLREVSYYLCVLV